MLVDEVPVGQKTHVRVGREAPGERRGKVRELALPEDLPFADVGRIEEIAKPCLFEPPAEPLAVAEPAVLRARPVVG